MFNGSKVCLFAEQTIIPGTLPSVHRTDTDLLEAFFENQRTDRQFPGRYPSPNKYFSNRSRWLLSNALSARIFPYL